MVGRASVGRAAVGRVLIGQAGSGKTGSEQAGSGHAGIRCGGVSASAGTEADAVQVQAGKKEQAEAGNKTVAGRQTNAGKKRGAGQKTAAIKTGAIKTGASKAGAAKPKATTPKPVKSPEKSTTEKNPAQKAKTKKPVPFVDAAATAAGLSQRVAEQSENTGADPAGAEPGAAASPAPPIPSETLIPSETPVPSEPPEALAAPRQPARLWTLRVRTAFLDALAELGQVRAAARAAGISSQRVYRERQKCPEFAKDWSEAMDRALDALEEMLLDRAMNGVEKQVYYGGKSCGSVRQYSDALAMFLLRARRPETYGRAATGEAAPTLSAADGKADGKSGGRPDERADPVALIEARLRKLAEEPQTAGAGAEGARAEP